jgi:protein TonB
MKSLPRAIIFGFFLAAASLSFANKESLPAGDAYPVIVRQVPPEYPKELVKERINGEVIIEFIVEKDGTVQTTKIVRQTKEAFGLAAQACVRKWTFKPGLKAGVPVRCLMQIPITFKY